MHLSHRDVRRLGAFIEVLSAPLTFPDSSSWRREILSRGQALLSTDRAVFGLDWDAAHPVVDAGLDPAATPAYLEYYHRFEQSHVERRRTGQSVAAIHHELTQGRLIPPEFRHDFLSRFHLDAGGGMAHDVAAGATCWCAFYAERQPPEEFEDHAVPILEVALPAFRAGLDTLFRTRALRTEFTQLLDQVSDGFLLLDRQGGFLHQNSRLQSFLASDPESYLVERALHVIARRFSAGVADTDGAVGLFRTVAVVTHRASYDVSPTIPGCGLGDLGVGLIVQVIMRTNARQSSDILWDQFGLTAREIEVTRFLLQGSSYKSIAQRLGVSIDTVRSHIRRVYAKLRVHSVAEAVNRVLGEKLG